MKLHPLKWANAPDNYFPKWIIENVWQGDGVNFLFGTPKLARKTSLRRYLVACAMTGEPAFGLFPVKRKLENPLLMILEDHPGSEKYAIRKVLRTLGYDREPELSFLQPPWYHIDNHGHLQALIDLVEKEGHDFVTIDPLVNFHGKEENDNSAMGQVTSALHYLRNFAGVAVIHHDTKPNEQGGFSSRTTGQRLRGGGVLGGASNVTIESRPRGKHRVRLAFEIKTPADDTPEPLEIAWNKENGLWEAQAPFSEDTVLAMIARNPGITRIELHTKLNRNKQKTLQFVKELLDANLLNQRGKDTNAAKLYCSNVSF